MKKLALTFPGDKTISEYDTEIFGKSWRFGRALTGTKLRQIAPTDIINAILPFIFAIAGLILFGMLIAGGFTIFTSAGNPEKIKKGQGIIVNALVGFLIIFASFWIIQLIEASFGLPTIFG